MTLRNSLTFSLILVSSCAGVMGREFIDSPYFEHWLRALTPPDNCDGASAGDKVKDTNNCKNFYICTAPGIMSDDPSSCPDMFRCFDPKANTGSGTIKGECSNDYTGCLIACGGVVVPTCKLAIDTCTALGDKIPDAKDCSKYDYCIDGSSSVEIYCPSYHPYFNGDTCEDDYTHCCNCRVEICASKGQKLPDPLNCKAFYTCVEVDSNGGATFTAVGPNTCPDGGIFTNGNCDSTTTSCDNICHDLAIAITTTSSSSSPATTTTSSVSSTAKTTTSSNPSPATTTKSSGSSTATTTPSSDSSTATTTAGCTDLSDFTCTPGIGGYYPRCSYCDPSYFNCNGPDAPTQGSCSEGLVFNIIPQYPKCILPEKCPYTP